MISHSSAPLVHIINSLDAGGAERMLSQIASHQACTGQDVIVVCLKNRGHFGEAITAAGVELHCLEMPNKSFFRALLEIRSLIRTRKPAFVMSWLYHADLMGTLACLMTGHKDFAWNLRCSDIDFSKYSPSTHLVVRTLALLSRFPREILSNNRAGIEAHKKLGYTPPRWTYMPNGFDLESFYPDKALGQKVRDEFSIPEDAPIIGTVARNDPQKDYPTLLKAARTVLAQNPAARFLLIGADTDKLDLTEAERTKIICTGRRKDINALLNAMDTFILTSAYGEGFPNVLGEALAVGLPCISTDVGDARDLLAGHGTVIPKQDAETLSSNILGLLEELQAQKLKSPERRQYIVENFDIRKICGRYSELMLS
ncbi:glycosyltransferase [Kiloniella sp. b19]|uniref:glycosyltransferase n=1 Tax=Kiloniella sp. GXU_MW_B19 TaxID=3141326 RepID=UPI0031DC38FE